MDNSKKLTEAQIKAAASKYNLEVALVKAVMFVESSGGGFNPDGSLKIQFEPRPFERMTKYKIINGVEGQKAEYEAYNKALAIDKIKAMLCTSFGLPQIMGFNFRAAGYNSPSDMVNSFMESEYNQLCAMLHFISSDPHMYNALKEKRFADFADLYNGPGYDSDPDPNKHYDVKLGKAYERFVKILPS